MNVGKKFEQNWKASVPDDIYYQRLNDNASVFTNSNAKYSVHNPYDCFLFSDGMLLCLELKSTNKNYMTFERTKDDAGKKMIHIWQIEGLLNARKHEGVHAGFLFNFRNDEKGTEATFYQEIDDFLDMIGSLNKISFKITDLLMFNPLRIEDRVLRKNYRYDVRKLFEDLKMAEMLKDERE